MSPISATPGNTAQIDVKGYEPDTLTSITLEAVSADGAVERHRDRGAITALAGFALEFAT